MAELKDKKLQKVLTRLKAARRKIPKKYRKGAAEEIIDNCQALVDEHFDSEGATDEQRSGLMPNRAIGSDGKVIKEAGSILPEAVLNRIYDLSYEFMKYADNLPQLGLTHYQRYIGDDGP